MFINMELPLQVAPIFMMLLDNRLMYMYNYMKIKIYPFWGYLCEGNKCVI